MKPGAYIGLALGWVFAQLSGVVNQYAAVVSAADPANLTVDNAAGFSAGDRILVYQAKGASINTSNSSSYGDITAINGAGLFEFNTIQSISGNALTLKCALTRPFGLSSPATARIQVVKVSYHSGDVTISGTVTAPAWDGQKGGIVVIETEGTLTFNADIDVSGRGFQGGSRSTNASGSGCYTTPYVGPIDDIGSGKGENIAEWLSNNHRGYRGKSANGGGGGNAFDTGGGGGGNYGTGGQGGWTTCASAFWSCGGNVANSGFGLGGEALSGYLSSNSLRLFFGGGGGGGHQNNNQGGNGGPGGGIVIIRAGTIQGGGRQIIARGAQGVQNLGNGCNQTNVSFAGNDGGGGGGAGGAVALFCNTYAGNLTIDVRGANGQNCSFHLCSCRPDHGPGGGGGGGYVVFSTANLPAGVSLQTAGGANGIELTPVGENMNGCNNIGCGLACINCIPAGPDRLNRGATSGAPGGVLYKASLSPYDPCPLADIRLLRWRMLSLPTGQLRHEWLIESAEPIQQVTAHFLRKEDKAAVEYPLAFAAAGEALHALTPGVYEVILYAQTASGTKRALARQTLNHTIPFVWEGEQLSIPAGESFTLYDANGRILHSGVGPIQVSMESLPAGLYLLQVSGQTHRLWLWR